MLKHEVSSRDIELKKRWKRKKEALQGALVKAAVQIKKSGHEVALGAGKRDFRNQ